MNQEFIDVLGYEGIYQVNREGVVKSLTRHHNTANGGGVKKGRIMKSFKDGCGYLSIDLRKNAGRKRGAIHRLIAIAFIPNPEKKPFINHINGVKDDNRIENLEWVTSAENHKHAYDTGLKKKPFTCTNPRKGKDHQYYGKKGEDSFNSKIILDTQTGIFYYGGREAALAKGISLYALRDSLLGRQKNKTSLTYV